VVKTGTGLVHLAASRSRCCRIACAEPDWAVGPWGSLRRKVRVDRLTVNPQIARTITNTYQFGRWRLANRESSEDAAENIILYKL
jgi:hypothetical protein